MSILEEDFAFPHWNYLREFINLRVDNTFRRQTTGVINVSFQKSILATFAVKQQQQSWQQYKLKLMNQTGCLASKAALTFSFQVQCLYQSKYCLFL